MISPQRVATLAVNTAREAVRNKVLYVLLFFAILLIGTGVLISMLSYVEGERILQNVGLAAIRLIGAGMAVFMGVGIIHREIDRRTLYTVLSKPVSRTEFILGKYLGLVGTLWMQVAIMGVAFVAVSLLAGAPLGSGHFVAIGLAGLELAVLVAVATLFSAVSTPLLASLFTAGLYLIGHFVRDLRGLGSSSSSEQVAAVTELLGRVLPDLEHFNVTVQAVHGLPIGPQEIWLPVLYALGWATVLLAIASVVFERRDLR